MTSKQAERKPAAKYRLKFVPDAWREWQALDGSIKQALKTLLAKRLQAPHVLSMQEPRIAARLFFSVARFRRRDCTLETSGTKPN